MRSWVIGAWLAAVAIAISCNQPNSNPHDVISLAVDTAPAPSVVAGDTMRVGDTTTLGRLHAHAYNINQKPLAISILWLTLDPLIVSTDTFGHVFAGTDSVPSTPRIVAQAGDLQSLPFSLPVVPRPDSVARDTTDTTQHLRGFCNGALPITTGFDANLFHRSNLADSASTPVPVSSYLIHWTVTSPANLAGKQTGTIADTALIAYIADLSGNPSILDTTKSGLSTRVLTFGARAFDTTIVKHDSTITVMVQATARYQGRQLPNPVQVTITFVNPRKC
jgi:hypothetical protein